MLRWNKLIKCSLVTTCLSLSSCDTNTIKHPLHGLAVDQMRSDLLHGIKENNKQHNEALPVPQSVSRALIPSAKPTLATNSTIADKHFDVSANNIPAKSFFMSLVEGTPNNMVVSPNITGNVSLELKNVTVEETLEAVHDAYGFDYHKTSYGYEILPPRLETEIFAVNYIDVKRKGDSLTQLRSGEITESVGTVTAGGSASSTTTGSNPTNQAGAPQTTTGTTVDTTSEANFWKSLDKTLKEMIGTNENRNVVVNAEGSIVMVRAFPNELHQVARYLDRLQANMNRQVIIDAKILEVELDDQFQAGVDWNLIGDVATGQGGVAQTSMDAFDNTHDLKDFTSIFTLRINGDFGGLIKLLQTQGTVQVLSSPRISTVNNQKAVIKVGQDQFFVTGITTTTAVTGIVGTALPSESISLTPFFSGINLDVTPQISKEGEIILHIHPSISEVKDQEKTIVLGNGGVSTAASNTFILPLAESTIRESDNVVRAKSGQIVVIGGLIQNVQTEQVGGVPFLSKLPIIGPFFRRTEQVSTKNELVILLRPTITSKRVFNDDMKTVARTFDNMNRGFHDNTLPEVFGNEAERTDQF